MNKAEREKQKAEDFILNLLHEARGRNDSLTDMLSFTDPDGWVHLLGNVTEDTDYAKCGQIIGEGWRAKTSHRSSRCIDCFHE